MRAVEAIVGALSPNRTLRLYMVVVLVTAILALGSVIVTSNRADHLSQEAAREANAAVEASKVQSGLRQPLTVLVSNGFGFVAAGGLDNVSLEARANIVDSVMQTSRVSPPVDLPAGLMIPIPERDGFDLRTAVATYGGEIDNLASMAPEVNMNQLLAERDRLRSAVDTYLGNQSAANFRDVMGSLTVIGGELQDVNTQLAEDITSTQVNLRNATDVSRYTMIAALLALTLTMCVTTFFVSRMIHKAFVSGETERDALQDAKSTLQYRNDQLNALYNVFSEITDTLSMRYVISATLRETLRVMNASMVTMRLLRGSQLVVAGNLTSEGREIANMSPVPLGEGPTGRVARRGRSMRVNTGAQDLLGPSIGSDFAVEGLDSGIIVPLIVGARVVGTLACWSKETNAYGEEDERILEMMASQVATAVIAADQTESSERRAMLDPLTNLPNRRQLNADIAGELSTWADESRHAVVAMIDIDHFKDLNDDFGHRVGDVTLQKVASVMRHSIRDADRIYRYGGEEFVVIFAAAHAPEATLLAERLRKAVEETPLSGDKLEPVGPVTISIGLALMPEHGADFNALIELADRAMYRAKDAGRNRILTWGSDSAPSPLSSAA